MKKVKKKPTPPWKMMKSFNMECQSLFYNASIMYIGFCNFFHIHTKVNFFIMALQSILLELLTNYCKIVKIKLLKYPHAIICYCYDFGAVASVNAMFVFKQSYGPMRIKIIY